MDHILRAAGDNHLREYSRIEKDQDPFEQYQKQIKKWAEAYDKDAIHMTQEQFDEIYNDAFLDAMELE